MPYFGVKLVKPSLDFKSVIMQNSKSSYRYIIKKVTLLIIALPNTSPRQLNLAHEISTAVLTLFSQSWLFFSFNFAVNQQGVYVSMASESCSRV